MPNPAPERSFIRQVIREEAQAVADLAERLGPTFDNALDLLDTRTRQGGTIIVTGLGKSGLIGAKIAATFASLGVPAHCVHPAEAAHGDLGRFRPSDAVIAISHSGETHEVVNLASILRQDNLPIIAITRGPITPEDKPSSLERLATITLAIGVPCEAGAPKFLAPTSSTTATLVMGDALALALAERRNFTDADFARRHPGGTLGGLLRSVVDVLRFRVDDYAPLPQTMSIDQALRQADSKGRRPGALMIVDPVSGRLTGIFTDGDLRRLILRNPADIHKPIADFMTKNPRTLPHTALVRDAVFLIRQFRQDEIPVVDDHGKPIGLLDVQDLIAQKLVTD